ncbi:MAG: ParB/RepB/Spo0J family partition protein [Candidatus Promineifilaceae bacterium]
MSKKRPAVDLSQPVQPRAGDLGRLFAGEGDVEQAAGIQVLSVRLDAILPDPDQPRRSLPAAGLRELSASIEQEGVIQPIEVSQIGANVYMLVHGERRWRAAQMAGLTTIPAVVRRQRLDAASRLVRQLIENIQREDLNAIDRAAGLLHLRELMQAEGPAAAGDAERVPAGPWAKTATWAKVGKRLGYSRQRIHQLIRLLDLPEEIKADVRAGALSEREARVYQGLRPAQQRDLHRVRAEQELGAAQLGQIARRLRAEPAKSVAQALRETRHPLPPAEEQLQAPEEAPRPQRAGRQGRPSDQERLVWVRGHLARVQPQAAAPAERQELLRLLRLIQQDVASLLQALDGEAP